VGSQSDPSYDPGRTPTTGWPAVGGPGNSLTHPQSGLPNGTGWSGGQPGPEYPYPPIDDADGPRRRPRGYGRLFWLAGVLAVIVVAVLGVRSLSWWPFEKQTTDKSPPALLLSITDLARFEAASGNFEKVIDIKQDISWLPDWVYSEHTLFICLGSVDAYVDFGHVAQGDIDALPDHKTVTVRLPAPQLEKPNIDHDKSHVFSVDKGVANRISSVFDNDPGGEQKLYQLGEQKIAAAAKESNLSQRAAENTRLMLTQLLKSLGYTSITVKFTET
jgi:hypothetical protein